MHPAALPRRAGIAFKPQHFAALSTDPCPVGFIEVHAENYLGGGGPAHAQLGRLRESYALSVHGVGLSIGSAQPLDPEHLLRLRRLCDRYDPHSFSEHLAWSSHDGIFLNDLLPLPYDAVTLRRVVQHVEQTQQALGRQILLENPASYLAFADSTLDETQFLREIAQRTGCGLLLDLNNVLVASTNHRTDPRSYLSMFPLPAVGQIHLAGHAVTQDDAGAVLLIDSHDAAVSEPVWALYREVIEETGPVATLIEWDNDVPAWHALRREADIAQTVLDRAVRHAAA